MKLKCEPKKRKPQFTSQPKPHGYFNKKKISVVNSACPVGQVLREQTVTMFLALRE